MRFVTINLFLVCLFLFGAGYLAFGHDEIETTSESHGPDMGDASWDAALETFYELLKTDPKAARVELENVAKTLFDGHPRTEEWVELFYQVFYQISLKEDEEKKTEPPWQLISEIKRLYELGLEILTSMDTEKYAKQIQVHQDALDYYTELTDFAEIMGDKSLKSEEATPNKQNHTSQSESELSDAEDRIAHQQYMEKFFELLPTDPEAARQELETYAAKSYQGHPLTEEWVKHFFRMGSEGEASVSDIIHFMEMTKQIRTDMDPEKHAKEIKGLEDNLAQLKMVAKFYERDGITDAKIPFNPNVGDKQSEEKSASDPLKVSHTEKIGKPAPDFQVMNLKGQEISLKKYRGQVVLLDFWATWCFPCRAEMPNLKRVYDKYKDQKFEIIGISLDQTRAVVDSYTEKQNITWQQFLDSTGTVTKMYNVTGIPATFLIDGDGIVRKVKLHGRALEDAVAELVKENLFKQTK